MDRRTLLERIGVVATTGVLVGCLDEGPTEGDGPGAGGNGDGNGTGDGNGNGSPDDGDDTGDPDDDGGESGGSDDSDGSDDTGDDGTGGDAETDDEGTDDSSDGDESDADDSSEEDGSANETDAAGADDADGDLAVGRSRVETTNADCASDGDDAHDATVTFAEDRLEVAGHLQAPNPCHEAVLERVGADDGSVLIEVGLEAEDGFCTECLGRIEYEATVELEAGTPDEVAVAHRDGDDRTEVATESPS